MSRRAPWLVLAFMVPCIALGAERPYEPVTYPQVAARLATCGDAAASWRPTAGVTLSMKLTADSFLIKRLGPELFAQMMVFDPIETDSTACRMQRRGVGTRDIYYLLVVPSDRDVATRARVGMNLDGTVDDCWGIPDCAAHPGQCHIIDRRAAYDSAAAAGLEAGIRAWEWSFYCGPLGESEEGLYYEVRNTIGENAWEEWGELVRVRASDGKVFWRMATRHAKGPTGMNVRIR